VQGFGAFSATTRATGAGLTVPLPSIARSSRSASAGATPASRLRSTASVLRAPVSAAFAVPSRPSARATLA
jgi:hypothetical protein